MILAGMIRTDETALICDLAETYGILDYRALPLKTAAALSVGLREDSRIRMKLNGQVINAEITLLAAALDRLTTLVWMKTEDGVKGRNRPLSVLAGITKQKPKTEEHMVFNSPEAFKRAWAEATKGGDEWPQN